MSDKNKKLIMMLEMLTLLTLFVIYSSYRNTDFAIFGSELTPDKQKIVNLQNPYKEGVKIPNTMFSIDLKTYEEAKDNVNYFINFNSLY